MPSHTGHGERDVESGESDKGEAAEALEGTSAEGHAEKAKNEFRTSLLKTFSDIACVEEIMRDVGRWELGL